MNIPVSPPLVVVQPGIQVVENWEEEVFFTGGYYWVRRDGYWYRAPSPRATWVYVEPHRVPPGLTRLPPGHYKHYHKQQAKAEKKAHKDYEKAHHKESKGNGKGKGHGPAGGELSGPPSRRPRRPRRACGRFPVIAKCSPRPSPARPSR